MTSETMTAEDVKKVESWVNSFIDVDDFTNKNEGACRRILATYTENARLREENERLTVRLDETTKVAAHLLCEDEKLHARLAEVEQDSKRLDVLADDLPFDGIYGVDLHLEAGATLTNEATDEEVKHAYRAALRYAIDQERVRLESPPIDAALSRPTGDKE